MTQTRILTTHTGSLPRPTELVDLWAPLLASGQNESPVLERSIQSAIESVVAQQRDVGLDVINDGEMSKVSYATYIKERLSGFGGQTRQPPLPEFKEYPEYVKRLDPSFALSTAPACDAPVTLQDPLAVQRDIDKLRTAVGGDLSQCFMSAASPGVVSMFFRNEYYATREEYLGALVDAMRPEYRAIVDAGLVLQLDCPDLGMGRNAQFSRLSVEEFRREASLNIEALNAAVSGLAPERVRMHLCWGNYEGPHHLDVPLRDILDVVLRAAPHGLAVEASNPRHGHEWSVFEDVALPDGKYLIPGVIDSTSNYIEHPELVAQRIRRYTDQVGPERVMAGVDCGFGTFVGMSLVEPRIAWAKLATLVAGAHLASADPRS
jgi:5-methyltetrahydropteroyltriglutamate--homocysteine methyltransferase